jgi:mannose-P-dolichol utilization defect protein 1
MYRRLDLCATRGWCFSPSDQLDVLLHRGVAPRVAYTLALTSGPLRQRAQPKVSPTNTTPRHISHNIAAMDALRSVLQPITHNLPKPITDLGTSLIGPACYKTLLLDIDPSNTECLKLAVSKGLGIGIIGASSIVKVPQLLKLINSQSAEGLSFLSYLLESGAYLISLSYNVRHGFPFSTYGETALILIQNIAIASLVLKYSGNSLGIAGWVGGLIAAGSALFNEQWVGDERLSLLQATAGVLGVASKVPQILTIWTEGGTGQLSAFAVSS